MNSRSNQIHTSLVAVIAGNMPHTEHLAALLRRLAPQVELHTCTTSGSIATCLAERPHLFILDTTNARESSDSRRLLLETLRDRLGNSTRIALLLSSEERLFEAGDLLFKASPSLQPSNLLDAFIVSPPAHIPQLSALSNQLSNLISSIALCHRWKEQTGADLPALNATGWAESLADPLSRELWYEWLPRYARYVNETPVIIGETGSGKTNLARAIHDLSARSGNFVTITPRDFSSSELIQSELFGAVAGAYTGAVDRWGLVKRAEGGTLFIDELQSIDTDLQGKIITFIENKTYRRVGSPDVTQADVRLIFASNRSLAALQEAKILREDFAYRLERVQLTVLPLRSRPLDIAAAAGFALAKIYRERPQAALVRGFTKDAYRQLFAHAWPGNLRQLENTIARLCDRANLSSSEIIDQAIIEQVLGQIALESLVPSLLERASAGVRSTFKARATICMDEVLNEFQQKLREEALKLAAGDTTRAAELLSESEQTLEYVASVLANQQESP